MRLRRRHLLWAAAGLPLAALLVAWLGVINVGAASGHWRVTEWFLHFVMRSSIRTHALLVEPPRLPPDEALVPAAGHYHRTCATCHGAPGVPRWPAAEAMLPPAPYLPPRIDAWTDRELFRIVRYGIRYSSMPSWLADHRDDEAWAMVAFLRRLPELTPEGYRAAAALPPPAAPTEDRFADVLADCTGCHGRDGRGGGPRVPALAGQDPTYLRVSLEVYDSWGRASGFMRPPASGLDGETRARLAAYFARLPPPEPTDAPVCLREAGARLAVHGRPEVGIPACLECHGVDRRKAGVPMLDAQPADYLAIQLRLFRDGHRGGGPRHHLMTRAARFLTDAEIAAAAAFFASRPPGAATPAGTEASGACSPVSQITEAD